MGLTDDDGTARITLPTSFTNKNYAVGAIHSGDAIAVYSINAGYKGVNFLPILVQNYASGQTDKNWTILYIAIGY